ncbi:YwbE family protein [Polaribacter vadi]|uniref:YwbE family protein n=1 Tax=Polaribacter vadi TaxID=1774273 RepID=UPI0030EE1A73|tara:strand:- start:7119 stop:7319 length:201 start_codon:yes stop_codon:yes gene_type:complete
MIIDGRKRQNIKIGMFVEIIQKPHQRSGELTKGAVAKILTKSIQHPYGIKVQLESGLVGRVKNVIN